MTRSRSKRASTAHAGRVLDRITGLDPGVRGAIADHRLHTHVAEMILAAHEKAGLTQAELAKLAGTTKSVISRLEDADYDGHSLSMLRRIAEAMNHRVEVRLVAASAGHRRSARRA